MPVEVLLTPIYSNKHTTHYEVEELASELQIEIERASNNTIPTSKSQRKNEGILGPEWRPALAVLVSPTEIGTAEILFHTLKNWMKNKHSVSIAIKGPSGSCTLVDTAITEITDKEFQRIRTQLGIP